MNPHDEAREIINRLLAAGCPPSVSTCEGWIELHRTVDAVESCIFEDGVAEYERVNPTGLRLVRAWSWFAAKFGDEVALKAKQAARC